jgi:lysophosphatidate acyltransferase
MLDLLLKFICAMVYLSVPFYLLKAIPNHWPAARYYFRIFTYLSALSVCSVWGVIVSIFMTVIDRRFDINYVVARSFYFVGRRALGISFVVEGEHHLKCGPAVLVGNHQSMLDILYLGR